MVRGLRGKSSGVLLDLGGTADRDFWRCPKVGLRLGYGLSLQHLCHHRLACPTKDIANLSQNVCLLSSESFSAQVHLEYELKPICHLSNLRRVRHRRYSWGWGARSQGSPCSPMTLLITTMWPCRLLFMAGSTALTRRTAPKKLVSNRSCMAARLSPSRGPARPTPALFTKQR